MQQRADGDVDDGDCETQAALLNANQATTHNNDDDDDEESMSGERVSGTQLPNLNALLNSTHFNVSFKTARQT